MSFSEQGPTGVPQNADVFPADKIMGEEISDPTGPATVGDIVDAAHQGGHPDFDEVRREYTPAQPPAEAAPAAQTPPEAAPGETPGQTPPQA